MFATEEAVLNSQLASLINAALVVMCLPRPCFYYLVILLRMSAIQ